MNCTTCRHMRYSHVGCGYTPHMPMQCGLINQCDATAVPHVFGEQYSVNMVLTVNETFYCSLYAEFQTDLVEDAVYLIKRGGGSTVVATYKQRGFIVELAWGPHIYLDVDNVEIIGRYDEIMR